MTNRPQSPPNTPDLPPLRLGLPMWQHNHWPQHWFGQPAARKQGLHYYARQFSSVEGNTTFYALPQQTAVQRWHEDTPADFRFSFKWYQKISHELGLLNCAHLVEEQLQSLAPLGNKLGILMLQLPASFGPEKLDRLAGFLSALPTDIHHAVEVRHPAFFAKGDAERELNQCLMSVGVNRVIMDTRALFKGPCDSTITEEVRHKKPRLPVNVIATGTQPVVRFVGGNNEADNLACLQPWIAKCHQWRQQGRSPYLFLHRPDNRDAPWLAELFIRHYNQTYPDTPLPELQFTAKAEQSRLF